MQLKPADENSPPPDVLGSPSGMKSPPPPPDLEIAGSPNLEPLAESGSEDGSCAICFAVPRCVRNRPCGHAVACGLCTVKAMNASTESYSCPTCRQPVEEVEWHGADVPARMATDGRALSAGTSVCSTLHGFLQARAASTSDAELAEAARRALSTWGGVGDGGSPGSVVPLEESFPLVAAAEAGDVDRVMQLLARGEVDVNLADAEGWTALIAASSEGHADVVTAILGADGDGTVGPVDVDACNLERETALMRAALIGDARIVHALLRAHADVNLQTRHGKSALIIAASTGRLEVVQLLLHAPLLEITQCDADGKTALMHAVSEGHTSIASALRVRARELTQAKVRTARAMTARAAEPRPPPQL